MGSEEEAVNLTADSPTSVTIVPMRPVIDVPQKTVQSPFPGRPIDVEIPSAPTGSYNPADPGLAESSLPSSKGRSAINEGQSVVSESVAESSPLGKPTANTVGGFSEKIKHKTPDSTVASVSANGGVSGGKFGKGSKANNHGVPALVGSDSESSEAPPVDESKPLNERTSRAERRAKQDTDQAAKEAANEADGKGTPGGDSNQAKNSKGQHIREKGCTSI